MFINFNVIIYYIYFIVNDGFNWFVLVDFQ